MRHIVSTESLRLLVQHLWIAHPDVTHVKAFMDFIPYPPDRFEDVRDKVNTVLHHSTNAPLLAIHWEIYTSSNPQNHLIELVTGRCDTPRQHPAPTVGPHRSLRRTYLALKYKNTCLDSYYGYWFRGPFPLLESIEIVCQGHRGTVCRYLYDFLSRMSSPHTSIKMRSEEAILIDIQASSMPIAFDPYIVFEALGPSLSWKDASFMMDE
jgi:hypothetical protein